MNQQLEELISKARENIEHYYNNKPEFQKRMPTFLIETGTYKPPEEWYLSINYQIFIFLNQLKTVDTQHAVLDDILKELEPVINSTEPKTIESGIHTFLITDLCNKYINNFPPMINLGIWKPKKSALYSFLKKFCEEFQNTLDTRKKILDRAYLEFCDSNPIKSARSVGIESFKIENSPYHFTI